MLNVPYLFEGLIVILVGASVFSPVASTCSLLVMLSAALAHKYFTRNVSDQERLDLQVLKTDFAKIKSKVEQDSLSKAFRG